MNSLRKQKIKLFKENNKCFYCKCEMVLTNVSHGKLPKNAATIEHLISRFDPRRTIPNNSRLRRRVLACYKCNNDRSHLEALFISRAEELERSNHEIKA